MHAGITRNIEDVKQDDRMPDSDDFAEPSRAAQHRLIDARPEGAPVGSAGGGDGGRTASRLAEQGPERRRSLCR